MHEAEARRVLLLRAFEDPIAAPWSEAQRDAVSRTALRELGEQAPPPALIARRAALAVDTLARSDATLAAALAVRLPPAWAGALLCLLALAGGVIIDQLGEPRRVNLFALPLWGMVAWNLAVYALLAIGAWRHRGATLPTLVRRWLRRALPRKGPPPLPRFADDWLRAGSSLFLRRLAAWLHLAAALLAGAALLSLYARGAFVEYRAGWDSTFFGAPTMHALMSLLFGPASWLGGIALPDVAGFERLRFASGGDENAARWIHLLAITVAALVIVPRLLLAGLAAWQARRLARNFPLALDDAYFRDLLPGASRVPERVQVLPYSYHAPAGSDAMLRAALADDCRGEPALQWAESVPLAGEDEPERWLPPPPAGMTLQVALFALTATPERETHGAFVQALQARLPGGVRLLVLIDESGFRDRFADAAARLEQRRAAWRELLGTLDVAPRFVDLAAKAAQA